MKYLLIHILGLLAPLARVRTESLAAKDRGNHLRLEYITPSFKAEASFFKVSGFTSPRFRAPGSRQRQFLDCGSTVRPITFGARIALTL